MASSRPFLSHLRTWRDRAHIIDGPARWLARWLKRRTLMIPFGAGRGLRFQARDGTLGYALGLEEPLVQATLEAHLRPGHTFYDVGANVGFFTVLGARFVGPTGRVCAFEPLPSTAAQLRGNAARNGFAHVEVLEMAVADHVGTASLLVSEGSQVAKLDGARGPLETPTGRLDVPVTTIDVLVASGRLPPPDFVKMDVEGAEVEALRGMAETLRRYRPILLCELHETHAPVAALLRDADYDIAILEEDVSIEEAPPFAHVLARPHASA